MSDAPAPQPVAPATSNDNVMAAVATIPLVGLIIFFAMKDASDLVRFYAKQATGLTIVYAVLFVVQIFVGLIPLGIGAILGCGLWIVEIVLFVVWLVMFIYALQGKKYRMPVLADAVDQLIK
jgi:uncharacterized membrane protein